MSRIVRGLRAVRCAVALGALMVSAASAPLGAQHLLLPMDEVQANHLKAYGVTFGALREVMNKGGLFRTFFVERTEFEEVGRQTRK